MAARVREGSKSAVVLTDVLELLRQNPGTSPERRPSTIPPSATVHAIVGDHRFEVERLTPLEALLRARDNEIPMQISGKAEVALELKGTRVISDIGVEIGSPSRDARTVVVRFANLRATEARAFMKLLRHVSGPVETPFTRERIRTRNRIETILKALVWSKAKGHLVDARGQRARVEAVHFEAAEPRALVWRSDKRHLEPPFRIELRGPWSAFSFRVTQRTTFGTLLTTDVPVLIVRSRRRVWRRVDDDTRTNLVFAHPLWPEIEVTAPILDFSYGGLALRAQSEAMLLFPGLQIPQAEIVDGPAAGLVMRAEVCHVGGGQDRGDETTCGLAVKDAGHADEAWTSLVRDRLYPRTTSRSTPFVALWKLYQDSGYLNIAEQNRHHDPPSAENVEEAVRLLDMAPEIGMNVVWPSRRGVTGALTLVKLHEHTWFGQHMAKRSGSTPEGWPGRQVLREMHLHAYEHALRDKEARWLLGYVRHDAGWPKLVHVAFPHRAEGTGQTCIVPFRAIRVPCENVAHLPIDPRDEVRLATIDDIRELANVLARTRPLPYLEALDLVLERLPMSTVEAAWSRAGLMRERMILMVHRDGRPVAAGVFEATSEGVHVFGLLDGARLFALRENGEESFRSLLIAARSWFAERDRPAFVYLAEDDRADLDGLNAVDLGMADATVTPIQLLPDLLEHMWEVTESPPVLTM